MMWTPELWHWMSPIWAVVGLLLIGYLLPGLLEKLVNRAAER